MKEKNLKEVFDDLEKDPEIARQFEYFGALTRLVLEVEEERLYKNISKEELANRMGTKQEAISRFESLRHKPGYDFLARLSKALGGRLSITTNGDYACAWYQLRDNAIDWLKTGEMSVCIGGNQTISIDFYF